MSSDKAGSAGSSDGMSKKLPPPKMSESDYLAQQAQKAKDAISATLHEMAEDLKHLADPRVLVEKHPWASLGTSAALGFLIASAATPNREQTFAERIKSLFPEKPPQQPVMYVAEPPKQSKLVGHIMDAIKTAVTATISSAISGSAAAGGQNGQQEQPRASAS